MSAAMFPVRQMDMRADSSWKNLDRGVFLVNCLAIISRRGKVLIGRRENDPYIKELEWSFPGGRPSYTEPLIVSLKKEVRKKTGLDIAVSQLLLARILPERPQFLLLYYRGRIIGGKERPGELFSELRWVGPRDALRLFSTSVDPEIR